MARILGVDLPANKRIEVALTYIFGVGLSRAKLILAKTQIDPETRVKGLSEDEILRIRETLSQFTLEGDLRRDVSRNIKRLTDIGSYRGNRHRRKLPCRGQRTHTNARTKRGKAIAIAGKKKVTK